MADFGDFSKMTQLWWKWKRGLKNRPSFDFVDSFFFLRIPRNPRINLWRNGLHFKGPLYWGGQKAVSGRETVGPASIDERIGGEWSGVVARVLGLQEEGIFRTIVIYL